MGYLLLAGSGWGTPQPGKNGYPPGQHRMGYHPLASSGWGTPPPPGQNSRATTCYMVGGMPLAVTQEDFLFYQFFRLPLIRIQRWRSADWGSFSALAGPNGGGGGGSGGARDMCHLLIQLKKNVHAVFRKKIGQNNRLTPPPLGLAPPPLVNPRSFNELSTRSYHKNTLILRHEPSSTGSSGNHLDLAKLNRSEDNMSHY